VEHRWSDGTAIESLRNISSLMVVVRIAARR
jgi:hypothetical protein